MLAIKKAIAALWLCAVGTLCTVVDGYAASPQTVASVAALRAGNFGSYPQIVLTGWYAGATSGGGQLSLDTADTTSADNGCTIFRDAFNHRFKRQSLTSVDARQCGAKVDGVTDDRAAYQAAVDAVYAAGGGAVHIPAGSSYLGSTNYLNYAGAVYGVVSIVAKNGVSFKGDGPSSKLLATSGLGGGALYATFRAVDDGIGLKNVEMSDFTIDGQSSTSVPSMQAGTIYLIAADNINIHDLTILNANGQGIQVAGYDHGSNVCSIGQGPGNVINGCATAPGTVPWHAGDFVTGTGIAPGTLLISVGSTTATASNTSGPAAGVSVRAIGPVRHLRIHHNKVYNSNYIAIQVAQFLELAIDNNTVDLAQNNCIDLYGENGSADPTGGVFAVTGNALSNCLYAGIFPETVARGTITGNSIANSSNGIWINQINGFPQNIEVAANNITKSGFNGLGGFCIHMSGTGASGIDFSSNNCDQYVTYGMDIAGASGIVVHDNVFSYPSGGVAPIHVDGLSYSKIFNNHATLNTTSTVSLAGVNTAVFIADPLPLPGAGHFAYAGLPRCDATNVGASIIVDDSNQTTYSNTITGSGVNQVPAYCAGGSAWKVGAGVSQ